MTNKRNTLIYLDKDLVRRAKEHKINISRVTEDALKTMIPKTEFHPRLFITNSIDHGTAFISPFKIRKITLKDVGPIKQKTIEFKDRNLIIGGNATGKTSIFQIIKEALQRNVDATFFGAARGESLSGEINLVVEARSRLDYKRSNPNFFGESDCFVSDGLFTMIDSAIRPIILKYLVKTNAQLILTALEIPKGAENFNIIKLDNKTI